MTAPSPAAAGLPAEDVERVARAILKAGYVRAAWDDLAPGIQQHYRRLAAAALAEMRPAAAVPDPRFRDQLAETLWRRVNDVFVGRGIHLRPADVTHVAGFLVDQAMPTIAAEVEARVQAALAPVSHGADGGEER